MVGNKVYAVPAPRDAYDLPVFDKLKKNFSQISELIAAKKVFAAQSVRGGGIAAAVTKMCLGNGIGFSFSKDLRREDLFGCNYGMRYHISSAASSWF